jgi:peptidoglycan/LPS O-acetylase OafA/YrhL
LWLASPNRFRPHDRVIHVAASLGVVALALMICVANQTHVDIAIWYTLTPIATAAVLFDQVTAPQRWLAWVLTLRPVIWTGRRSYGLYLWHYPLYYVVLWTVPAPTGNLIPRQAFVFVLSFVVAAASYRFIEEPALRLKARYQRVPD